MLTDLLKLYRAVPKSLCRSALRPVGQLRGIYGNGRRILRCHGVHRISPLYVRLAVRCKMHTKSDAPMRIYGGWKTKESSYIMRNNTLITVRFLTSVRTVKGIETWIGRIVDPAGAVLYTAQRWSKAGVLTCLNAWVKGHQ